MRNGYKSVQQPDDQAHQGLRPTLTSSITNRFDYETRMAADLGVVFKFVCSEQTLVVQL